MIYKNGLSAFVCRVQIRLLVNKHLPWLQFTDGIWNFNAKDIQISIKNKQENNKVTYAVMDHQDWILNYLTIMHDHLNLKKWLFVLCSFTSDLQKVGCVRICHEILNFLNNGELHFFFWRNFCRTSHQEGSRVRIYKDNGTLKMIMRHMKKLCRPYSSETPT